jgi:hypothetical protein
MGKASLKAESLLSLGETETLLSSKPEKHHDLRPQAEANTAKESKVSSSVQWGLGERLFCVFGPLSIQELVSFSPCFRCSSY